MLEVGRPALWLVGTGQLVPLSGPHVERGCSAGRLLLRAAQPAIPQPLETCDPPPPQDRLEPEATRRAGRLERSM